MWHFQHYTIQTYPMNRLRLVLPGVIVMLFTSCRHEIPTHVIPPGNQPVNSGSCSSDSVYFANTILPIISSNCAKSGCHDPLNHEEGLVLNNYTGIMRIVQPGNASDSKLYKVIITTNAGDLMPPPPAPRLLQADISAIQKWINQGAKNNQCNAVCDTGMFTYSGAVAPILTTYCKGCHNPSSPGGGVDLSTYTAVKSVATSGGLMGSINHLSGYVAMPQGGNKLQDCQITQIEKWIQAGMPNN